MAGRRFIDLVTDAEEITQVRGIRAVVKRLCNDAVGEICGLHEWPFLWTVRWFQSVAEHTTGNVDVTNNSATVSGGSTSPAFTAAMEGRKFRAGDETAYYYVKSRDSATQITLGQPNGPDQPYQGDTATDQSYSIYKDEYRLAAEVDKQKVISNSDNGVALFSMSADEFDRLYPSPSGMGTPSIDVFLGRDVAISETGTVSMTASDRTLTGSGTSWTTVEGLTRGTKIIINNLIFTVDRVVSDTSIEVYEAPTSNIASGTAYKAILDNYIAKLHSIPDTAETFYYRFQRVPAILDADGDMPDLPLPMHGLILLRMLPPLWRHRGQSNQAVEVDQAFEKELRRWESTYNLPVLSRQYPIRPHTIQQSFQEARWPAGTGVPLFR